MPSLDTQILRALRSAGDLHLSPGELACTVGLELASLATRIGVLRDAGFDIEARPHLGYRLINAPDRLIADDLKSMLRTRVMGNRIVVFEKTRSTNDVALGLGADGAAEGTVVFAESQSAGRGRLGRRWESASRQGLWFSVLLRPHLPTPLWGRLTILAAVAVAETIESVTDLRALIKWPNDVLIAGRKVAGILIESRDAFVVVGIGINVNQREFSASLRDTATSLSMVLDKSINRPHLASVILSNLDELYSALPSSFDSILTRCAGRSALLGQHIEVWCGNVRTAGVAEALDENGGLLLRTDTGDRVCLHAGVATLQPANLTL